GSRTYLIKPLVRNKAVIPEVVVGNPDESVTWIPDYDLGNDGQPAGRNIYEMASRWSSRVYSFYCLYSHFSFCSRLSSWRLGGYLGVFAVALMAIVSSSDTLSKGEHRFLYVAEPGIRNYVEHGGVGVIVFDSDNGFKFVRR